MSLLDSKARTQALNVENILLKAGAGSGKTGILTIRFLKLLTLVEHPSQIQGMTFTNKAAAEMRSRILDALDNARNNPEPTSDFEREKYHLAKQALANSDSRGWNLENSPNSLQLSTIDSFCKKLLSRHTSSDLEKAVCADITNDAHFLYQEAAKETMALFDVEEYRNDIAYLLAHFGNKFNKVEALLCEMLEKRDRWISVVFDSRNDPRELLENQRKQFLSVFLATPYENICNSERSIKTVLAYLDVKDPELIQFVTGGFDAEMGNNISIISKLAKLFLTAKLEPKKRFTKKEGMPAKISKEDKEYVVSELKRIAASLQSDLAVFMNIPDHKFTESEWQLLSAAFKLMPVLLANLNIAFKEAKKVDFTEVALNALDALNNDTASDNAIYHATNIKHLLIDEYQDTSDNQSILLQLLVNNWSTDEGKSLFLVGDSCQSIYGFRGANLNQFLKAQKGIGQQQIKVLDLEVNFRSSIGIVDWVNRTFSDIFPQDNDLILGAGAYSPSAAVNIDDQDKPVEIHGFVNDKSATEEAEFIVNEIAHIQKNDPTASIAILGRTRSNLIPVIQKLNEREEISTHDVDLHKMNKQPIVINALALIRFMIDSTDQEALVALLNSGLIGIGYSKINQILKLGKDLYSSLLVEDLTAILSASEIERLDFFFEQYHLAEEVLFESDLNVLMKGLWLALNGHSLCENHQSIKNVDEVFGLLAGKTKDDITLEWLDEKMDSLYVTTEVDVNTARSTVELMTCHRAKGLEFDYVFIPGMGKTGRPNSKTLIAWSKIEVESELSVLACGEELGVDSKGGNYADFLFKLQSKRDREELTRLFYVAVTRAIKKCYLTGTVTEKNDKLLPAAKGSLFGIISGQVENDVQLHYRLEEDKEQESLIPEQTIVMHPCQREFPERNTLAQYHGLSHKLNAKDHILWELPIDKHEGIVIHALIEQINKEGITSWSASRLLAYKPVILSLLRQQGVDPSKMLASLNRVMEEVGRMINDPVFRYVSSEHHQQNDVELRVALKKNRKIHFLQIDKAFIGDDGSAHIVDWKSAKTSNYQSPEAMKSIQVAKHKEKMGLYKRAYEVITGKKGDSSLYFTNTREVEMCG